jgi:hypothetical protein
MLTNHFLLQAALEGLDLKRLRIEQQIAQVRHALSGRASSSKRASTPATEASDDAPQKQKASRKRVLSPEARERMAAAQKARWAKARGEA